MFGASAVGKRAIKSQRSHHARSECQLFTAPSRRLAEVEAGEEIAVTRHGKVIARLVPDHCRKAADAFRDFWADADEIDLFAPDDKPAEGVASLDD